MGAVTWKPSTLIHNTHATLSQTAVHLLPECTSAPWQSQGKSVTISCTSSATNSCTGAQCYPKNSSMLPKEQKNTTKELPLFCYVRILLFLMRTFVNGASRDSSQLSPEKASSIFSERKTHSQEISASIAVVSGVHLTLTVSQRQGLSAVAFQQRAVPEGT